MVELICWPAREGNRGTRQGIYTPRSQAKARVALAPASEKKKLVHMGTVKTATPSQKVVIGEMEKLVSSRNIELDRKESIA